MKKLAILFLGLTIFANNLSAHKESKKNQKNNKFSEFVKGAAGLAATCGFAYLAYKTPVTDIENMISSAQDQISGNGANKVSFKPCFLSAMKSLSLENFGNNMLNSWDMDKTKLCAVVSGILAWESLKYTIKKMGNALNDKTK